MWSTFRFADLVTVGFLSVVGVMMVLIFFFFQAEDGIRDLVRSRGLGDVYKRQATIFTVGFYNKIPTGALLLVSDSPMVPEGVKTEAVSYTHLTLPTSDLV